jgi:hypothetical protein
VEKRARDKDAAWCAAHLDEFASGVEDIRAKIAEALSGGK